MSLRIKSMADLPAMHRQSHAQPAGATQAKPRKYRNTPTMEDGQRFDSKLEAACYRELKWRQAAGELRYVLRQIPLRLEGGIIYRADFMAYRTDGEIEWIDAKGKDTQASINKRRQVKARYGIDVTIWRGR